LPEKIEIFRKFAWKNRIQAFCNFVFDVSTTVQGA